MLFSAWLKHVYLPQLFSHRKRFSWKFWRRNCSRHENLHSECSAAQGGQWKTVEKSLCACATDCCNYFTLINLLSHFVAQSFFCLRKNTERHAWSGKRRIINEIIETNANFLDTNRCQFSHFSLVANKQSSDGLSGLSSVEKLNENAVSTSRTNDRNGLFNKSNKSSSLELILTPIIQSRRWVLARH